MRKWLCKPMGLQFAGCSTAFKGDKITTRRNQSISKNKRTLQLAIEIFRPRMTVTCFKLAQKNLRTLCLVLNIYKQLGP